jgi:hypothetical protein
LTFALGQTSQQADQQGALQLLAGKPYGLVSLWLLGIGFAGYALWRLSEAAFGVTGEGNGVGPRAEVAGPGAALRWFRLPDLQGDLRRTGQPDQVAAGLDRHGHASRWRTLAYRHRRPDYRDRWPGPGFRGHRAKFMKYLQLSQMSPRTRRLVKWLGVTGTTARGLVVALAGVLVIEAAVSYQPSKAGGIDKALLTLRGQLFGEFLLILAALGLIIFGVYGLCEARWRRV